MKIFKKYMTPDRLVTVEEIMSHGPCSGYTTGKVKKLWGEKKAIFLSDICDLKISVEDRIWALGHLLPEKTTHSLACDFVWRVLPIFEEKCSDDFRPRDAVKAARRWKNGKIDMDELGFAWNAALRSRRFVLFSEVEDIASAAANVSHQIWGNSDFFNVSELISLGCGDSKKELIWQLDRTRDHLILL